MECNQCFPSQPFLMLTVDQFVGHGMKFLITSTYILLVNTSA